MNNQDIRTKKKKCKNCDNETILLECLSCLLKPKEKKIKYQFIS